MANAARILLLLSGPNLNLLGSREPGIYGTATLDDHVALAAASTATAAGYELRDEQHNHEGAAVEAVHRARADVAGIVVNPGAFTHYSWALHDALAAFDGPIVELHLSNPAARESFRSISVVAPVASGTICGFGGAGYRLAVEAIVGLLGDRVTTPSSADALVAMDVGGRLGRLRPMFDESQIDALVVTNLTNIRYLTGFTGSAGVLVVAPGRAVLVTDGRYADQAPAQTAEAGAAVEVEVASAGQDLVVAAALDGHSRVGLEADAAAWSTVRRYEAALATHQLVPTTELVERLRIRKDPGELDRMARAAAVADAALAEVRPMLMERPTEREFGLALDSAIRRLGASGNSFETIVASGPNGALPHARPTDRVIGDGDLVVLDFGAIVDGYCSDMTRTLAIGEISEFQQRMVEGVAEAQRAGVAAVRAGATGIEVDTACRDVLAGLGWADRFTHGTGHGVGLDIHEAPRVSSVSDATLDADFVVTVEPGVYIAPHGGVRIEDTVVVTASGCTVLTNSPKTLAAA